MRFFTVKSLFDEVLYHGISRVRAEWFLRIYPQTVLIETQM